MIDPKAIFTIRTPEQFEETALEIFRFQAEHCPPYRQYIGYLGIEPASIDRVESIPCLPVGLFKTHRVYGAAHPPEMVFTSSATTGQVPARHYVADLSLYEASFAEGFRKFYGHPAEYDIFALLPNYLQRSGSSLIYMVDRLIGTGGGGGFFLHDHRALVQGVERAAARGRKILLWGVSFALWDLAEQYRLEVPKLTVLETGGMKGYREEITREELHAILSERFGVSAIHSEYGMAELLSQAYSSGQGLFRSPPWMQVCIRDLYDPFERVPAGRTGGVNVIDLANLFSCSFLETQDLGINLADGSFRIQGRIDKTEIRGCNLMAG
ncbi:MAG: acyltransferase [Rikenellaceae bacterium]|nr:acyltransferase [Rikenellaceae bacterium]